MWNMARATPGVNTRTRRLLLQTIKAVLSLTFLGYVLNLVPLSELGPMARDISWLYVAAGLCMSLFTTYLNSIQMSQLTRHHGISLSTAGIFRINLITSFYNLIAPGSLAGGALRWYYFSKPDGKRAEAAAAIIFNRLLETAMLVCLGLVFWLQEKGQSSGNSTTLPMIIICCLSLGTYVLAMNTSIHRMVRFALHRMKLPMWLSSRMFKIQNALESYSHRTVAFHLKVMLIAIVRHLLGLASLFLLAMAVNIDVAFSTIGWIRSVLAIALMLPISIGGFGIREATFVTLLGAYGVAAGAALLLSLLVLCKSLFMAIIGGILAVCQSFAGAREARKLE